VIESVVVNVWLFRRSTGSNPGRTYDECLEREGEREGEKEEEREREREIDKEIAVQNVFNSRPYLRLI
jgi:hypothetical protein